MWRNRVREIARVQAILIFSITTEGNRYEILWKKNIATSWLLESIWTNDAKLTLNNVIPAHAFILTLGKQLFETVVKIDHWLTGAIATPCDNWPEIAHYLTANLNSFAESFKNGGLTDPSLTWLPLMWS